MPVLDTCHCRGLHTSCRELCLWTFEASLLCCCNPWCASALTNCPSLGIILCYSKAPFCFYPSFFFIEVSPLCCCYNSTTSYHDLLLNGSFSFNISLWFPLLLPLKSNREIRNKGETCTFWFCSKPQLVGLWDEQHRSLKSALLPDWCEGTIEILTAASGERKLILHVALGCWSLVTSGKKDVISVISFTWDAEHHSSFYSVSGTRCWIWYCTQAFIGY